MNENPEKKHHPNKMQSINCENQIKSFILIPQSLSQFHPHVSVFPEMIHGYIFYCCSVHNL